MQRYDFGIKPMKLPSIYTQKKPKKKRQLTSAQKLWCWENNPHTCNICGKRVTKISDAEFDHARPHSKGGATNLSNVKITHRQCNRLKGSKSLSETRRMLGVKSKKKKRKKTTRKKKRKTSNPFDFTLPKYKPPKFKL